MNVSSPVTSSPEQTSGSPFAKSADRTRKTKLEDLARLLSRLSENAQKWAQISILERRRYLQAAQEGMMAVAEEWVQTACLQKGHQGDSQLAGEEWLSGVYPVVRGLRLMNQSLAQNGQRPPAAWKSSPAGQRIARVFPSRLYDRLVHMGTEAEVWIEPEKAPSQGRIYRELVPGKVALVLGAGNVGSIGPLDLVYKLFAENQVVLLKMNPVNEYLGVFIERAFAALIADGYLGVVYGDAEVGKYLTDHPSVEAIHLTGSSRTHDAIVWGTGEEQKRRKESGEPRIRKEISSELGCVTPILVVPGAWSEKDIDFQARHVASMVSHNASFNCNAAKVLVTARDWPQRAHFLQGVRKALQATKPRVGYYPGAQQRHEQFVQRYSQAEILGAKGQGVVPWTLITDVPPVENEFALKEEAFCGLLSECSIPAQDPDHFLRLAVPFANDSIWGSLSCGILIHPKTQKQYGETLRQAVQDLQYGGIGINVWPALLFAIGDTSWGAYPGHPLEDIRSGQGVVHNSFLFDYPQKSVLRAPFRIFPKPVWFSDHKNLEQVGRMAARLEHKANPWRFAQLVWAALRG